jgi:G3E family GTPase
MTKIDIISGFLGAGKTTLIKKLLDEGFTNEKLVLIENEFGEIGIDGGFLKDSGVQITEMNSGCICCSLVGDFGKALNEVLDLYHPDRIVIEPSGVGKLSDVINAVKGVISENIILNSYTAVVDVKKCKMYMKNFGEFFNNQVESAKTIILSRTQEVTQDKLESCVALLREHNDKATFVTTNWADIKGSLIVRAMEEKNSFEHELLQEVQEHSHHGHEECCVHDNHNHAHEENSIHDTNHDHAHHHADEVFTSWGTETVRKYSKEDLTYILERLSEAEDIGFILRAKGIVAGDKGAWFHFDFVPGEYEIREGTADITGRLCVIGSKLRTEAIEKMFK